MKQILFFIFLFISYSVNAQNVTISNLIKLYNLDITDSKKYMSKLNWNFLEKYVNDDGKLTYAFTQKDANNNLIRLSKEYGENNFIGMYFYSRTKKVSYVNEIESEGFFLLDIYYTDKLDSKIEVYMKIGTELEFRITTDPNDEYYISYGVFDN